MSYLTCFFIEHGIKHVLNGGHGYPASRNPIVNYEARCVPRDHLVARPCTCCSHFCSSPHPHLLQPFFCQLLAFRDFALMLEFKTFRPRLSACRWQTCARKHLAHRPFYIYAHALALALDLDLLAGC